ncbi:type II secretion system inner membrane protein GspF [Permianibacter sp. IMCC34836]|uniref:type II secretion system inner membrane protein GspF n=1 Tax=Permianibacter fluminis TaxID=2738515 RepID=UPI0015553FFA|nr:type II secretion system inner membrane protein GspF [Permianibacter fluminis]NQD35664.1 type II secretion system inner membrane protein GspF [Permianibacter fluminis]
MPAFEYIALDADGRQKKGVLEADTARQIRSQLRDQALTPLEVNEVAQATSKTAASGKSTKKVRINTAEMALITRQLATLIRAALPVEEALKAVSDQCEKPAHKSMMLAVRARVVEGHSMADGLALFPNVFDALYRAMVAAGEKSGHLDEVLERLADYTEKRHYLRQKVQLALVYPIILVTVAMAVVSGLLIYVVPKVVEQFDQAGKELPLLTRIMISLSEFLQHWWWLVLAVIAITVFTAIRLLRQPAFRLRFDRKILRWPLVGRLTRGVNTARFARTLSILSSSAVPLLEGLRIAGEVVNNAYLKEVIREATTRVREGSSLRSAISRSDAFPPMLVHMIGSGESSGELDSMLEKAAENHEREFESLVGVTLGLLEPMLILGMGVMVLCIVLAILLPIFQMNQLIGR